MTSPSMQSRYRRPADMMRSAAEARTSPRLRLRTIILVVFAVILIWLVLSRSLTVYLASTAPQAALWLDPQQPQALVNLADRSISISVRPPTSSLLAETKDQLADSAAADPRQFDLDQAFAIFNPERNVDVARIRAWAESALTGDPLNPQALRLLAQMASVTGDAAATSKFMEAAARVSLHESLAVYWLMVKSVKAKDDKAAVSYADALLRTNRGLAPYVVPFLAHFAEQKSSNEFGQSGPRQ